MSFINSGASLKFISHFFPKNNHKIKLLINYIFAYLIIIGYVQFIPQLNGLFDEL